VYIVQCTYITVSAVPEDLEGRGWGRGRGEGEESGMVGTDNTVFAIGSAILIYHTIKMSVDTQKAVF
jgi:hypothetical protein